MIIGFSRAISASGAITIVGFVGQGGTSTTLANSLTNLTPPGGGGPVSAIDGDLVVTWGGKAHTVNYAHVMSESGYTEITEGAIYANASSNDTSTGCFYKFMTATPDANSTFETGASTTNAGAACTVVLRGVDTGTPLDVTSVGASSNTGNLADPAAITPVTANALIIAFYAGANDSTLTAATGPGNMDNFNHYSSAGGSTRKFQVGVATKVWTSGALDPDAWSGTDNAAGDSWAALTLAFRPA